MRALPLICLSAALASLAACGSAKLFGGDTGLITGGTGGDGGGTGGSGTGVDTSADPSADPWCNVQAIIATQCLSCHSTASNLGGLDLEASPWDAMVGVSSANYAGRTLVVPGDSAASFLVDKLEGTQAADEGTVMPPTAALSSVQTGEFVAWIDASAGSPECGAIGTTGGGTAYHPAG
ncbi:MAG: hypothetical protein GXP62_12820 [Oligoflexia bacterium]|nr:hypothetical protein [Oligoflexia bacterium]